LDFERFYGLIRLAMTMQSRIWRWLRFFLFFFDAERAHLWTLFLIQIGNHLGGRPLRWFSGGSAISNRGIGAGNSSAAEKTTPILGLGFKSRVGLAAGFDKNAEIVSALPHLGFGFAEIGTVTPLPQLGHPRPRLFRDPSQKALFNRMGFNNLGAAVVARNLRRERERLEPGFVVGVNLGKGRDTPLEDAASDYVRALKPFCGLADYVVINVSSPNTQGLRLLQSVEYLDPIVNRVGEELAKWSGRRPPLLLKLAPELTCEELRPILESGPGWGVSGWVLTNTLMGSWSHLGGQASDQRGQLAGGWSGGVLTTLARDRLREACSMTRLPIVSVGGIVTEDEAQARIDLGASLVQVYSGWIYQGPEFPRKISIKL
jgi:dihydroorotate dehydrogenase